jgi:hypothetical protein
LVHETNLFSLQGVDLDLPLVKSLSAAYFHFFCTCDSFIFNHFYHFSALNRFILLASSLFSYHPMFPLQADAYYTSVYRESMRDVLGADGVTFHLVMPIRSLNRSSVGTCNHRYGSIEIAGSGTACGRARSVACQFAPPRLMLSAFSLIYNIIPIPPKHHHSNNSYFFALT